MSSPVSHRLVSTDWLAARLNSPDTVPVDGSYYLPGIERDAASEYLAGHIASAVRFDIDAIADHSNPLPHMLPSAQEFARMMGGLGIAGNSYDGPVVFFAISAATSGGARGASVRPHRRVVALLTGGGAIDADDEGVLSVTAAVLGCDWHASVNDRTSTRLKKGASSRTRSSGPTPPSRRSGCRPRVACR